MKRRNLPILLMLLVSTIFGGCSSWTPHERRNMTALAYDGAVLGLTAADVAGKIPPAIKPEIQKDLGIARQRIAEMDTWIAANPILAETPGFKADPLGPMAIAVDVVRALARKYVLFGELAPISPTGPPASQPAPNGSDP